MNSMFKSILETKPTIIKNGEKIIDLTYQNYNPKKKNSIARVYTLTEDYEARPDKLANTLHSNISFVDLLLKTSDISNPFSISKDDIVIVYELIEMINDVDTNSAQRKNIEEIIRQQYIDETKKPMFDNTINKFRNEPAKLPPNITKIDQKDVIVKNGKVILGDNITQNNNCLKPIMSKSEVISLILKKKLNEPK
jgi:hypothetical protein